MSIGDHVIPRLAGVGTWQTYSIEHCDSIQKIDKRLHIEKAASLLVIEFYVIIIYFLQVNPSTAFRMLADFQPLKTASVIVQNGATSAVGRYIIQMAKR
jgi:trans-2-enoyl-CoA reductase